MKNSLRIFLILFLALVANSFEAQSMEEKIILRALVCPSPSPHPPRLVVIYSDFAFVDAVKLIIDENGDFENKDFQPKHRLNMKNLTLTWRSTEPTQCREINLLSASSSDRRQ